MKKLTKWIGSKERLLWAIEDHFPEKFNDYYEPFLGGGSIFFHFQHLMKGDCYLNDSNKDLMALYHWVKTKPRKLSNLINLLEEKNSEKFYYKVRDQFNERSRPSIQQSAMFSYLISKCFRGLCRYNAKGGFNAPYQHSIKRPGTPLSQILIVSNALKSVNLNSKDYWEVIKDAKKNDLIVLDPPYIPINQTSNFTGYTKDGFGMKQQEELAERFGQLADRGCGVIAFNNDVPFTYELYGGYKIIQIPVKRHIGKSKVASLNELMIISY